MGLISDDNKEKLIDIMILRRQRENKRKNLEEQERRNEFILKGLYFDGRKDNTMIT